MDVIEKGKRKKCEHMLCRSILSNFLKMNVNCISLEKNPGQIQV